MCASTASVGGPSLQVASDEPSVGISAATKLAIQSLSPDVKKVLADNLQRIRTSDLQRIQDLTVQVTGLQSQIAQLLIEKRDSKQKRLARSAAPDVRTLHTPPPVVLERHGVQNETPEEVCCLICAQRRERHVHLFLRYGDVGFQYQSLGKDPHGNHRATWAVVTHRVCDMAHETTIDADGTLKCVSLLD